MILVIIICLQQTGIQSCGPCYALFLRQCATQKNRRRDSFAEAKFKHITFSSPSRAKRRTASSVVSFVTSYRISIAVCIFAFSARSSSSSFGLYKRVLSTAFFCTRLYIYFFTFCYLRSNPFSRISSVSFAISILLLCFIVRNLNGFLHRLRFFYNNGALFNFFKSLSC